MLTDGTLVAWALPTRCGYGAANSCQSGMLEKAIENWLTSTNERNYQIPCVKCFYGTATRHSANTAGKASEASEGTGIVHGGMSVLFCRELSPSEW